MELLFFSDISQLDYVRASKPDLLRQMRPITGDMVVAFELERLGIDFIDEWDFLKSEDIEKNRESAHLLSTKWWDEHLVSTEYEGFSLTDAAQQDLIYPFEASLNARTVYERIFRLPVEKISGYFLPSVGVVRTGPVPTSRAVCSVTQAILLYVAEKHGVTVERFNSSFSLALGSSVYMGRPLHRKKDAIFSGAADVADKIILVYETGISASEHADLMVILEKLPGVKAISISQRVLELGTQSNIGNNLQFFWSEFTESINNYQGGNPEIFANKHLLFQFERIKKEMESASSYGNVFNAFLELLKPSLVIFGHEAFTIERVLVRLARNRKIPTVGLVHGGLGFKFAFRGLIGEADEIFLWNDIDIEWLTSFGVDKSRLNKIGSIRYESNYVKYSSERGTTSLKTKNAAKNHLGISQEKPLIALITAEINTGFAAPVAEPGKHREAIRGFLAFVDSRPDLQFIVKAHPTYDYFELYRRLLNTKRPNLSFLEQATLTEVLEASDICLMINYCTTAALEAMLYRVPVVFLDNAVYPLRDWQDSLLKTGINRVKTIVDLEKCIDNFLSNQVAKEQALTEADKQIEQFFSVNEVPANIRLSDAIKRNISDQQIGKTGSLLMATVMNDLLFSHDPNGEKLSAFYNSNKENNTLGPFMYAFAYLAGVNNLPLDCLRRIFEVFQVDLKSVPVLSWKRARWFLLPAFITGRINNSMRNESNVSVIWLLRNYTIYPHKFIFASTSFKKTLFLYLANSVLGSKFSILLWPIVNIFRKRFGLFR